MWTPAARAELTLLSGSVNSSADAQQAIDIANAFVGLGSAGSSSGAPSGGVSAGARGAVINNLTIRNKDQVMLRVIVVEVSRNVLKQFGVNMTGNWAALNPLGSSTSPALSNSLPFPITGGSTPGPTRSRPPSRPAASRSRRP